MKAKTFLTIVAVAAAMLTFSNAKAGGDGRLSIGAELAMPSGDYGDNAGTGFGLSLRYEMPMGDNLGLMGTVGYLTYGKKTVDFGYGAKAEYTSSMIPIMAGAKYYFTEQQQGFYGMAQLGVSMLSSKVTIPAYKIGTVSVAESSTTGSSSAFTYAPGIGYHLDNLDFGLSYYIFSYTASSTINGVTYSATASGSWIGLRVAYVLGGK